MEYLIRSVWTRLRQRPVRVQNSCVRVGTRLSLYNQLPRWITELPSNLEQVHKLEETSRA